MSTNTNELLELIQSLSVKEKIWVRQYASLSGPNTKYIKLFNFIEAQLEDEGKCQDRDIVSYFDGERFLNNLSKAKKYLFDSILEALSIFSFDQETEAIRYIRRAKIALDKNVYYKSSKLLKRGKIKLKELELYGDLLKLLEVEKNFVAFHPDLKLKDKERALAKINDEEIKVAIAFENYRLNRNLFDKYYYQIKISVFETGKVDRNVVNDAFDELSECEEHIKPMSTKAELFNLKLKRWLNLLSGEFRIALNFGEKIITLITENPFLATEFHWYLIQEFHQVCILNVQLKDKPEAIAWMQKMELEINRKSVSIGQFLLLELYLVMTLELSDLKSKTNAINLGRKINTEKDQFQSFDSFENYTLLRVFFYLSKVHFSDSNYSESLVWSGKIFNFHYPNIGRQIQILGKLLYLMGLYANGDTDGIISCSRQLKKLFKSNSQKNPVEIAVSEFIFNASLYRAKNTFKVKLEELSEKISHFKSIEKHAETFILFDFENWVNELC